MRYFPLLLVVALASAQGDKPKKKPAQASAQTAKQALEKLLAEQGVKVDKKKQFVMAEGTVQVTKDWIEFIAVGPRGKKHEALVTLRCLGSSLKAAFLAIGVKPGKNVDFKPVVPLPSEEEVMKGAPTSIVVPPTGTKLWLTLSWHDAKGAEHRVAIDDLLLDARAEDTLQKAEWIYFGGMEAALLRGEKPVFVADYDQNYISAYYTKPDGHLITIRHERGRYDDNWWPYTKRLPPTGTSCTLTFSLLPLAKRLPSYKEVEKAEKAAEGGKKVEKATKGGKKD